MREMRVVKSAFDGDPLLNPLFQDTVYKNSGLHFDRIDKVSKQYRYGGTPASNVPSKLSGRQSLRDV